MFLAHAGFIDIFETVLALELDIKILTKKIEPPFEQCFRFFDIAAEDGLGNLSPDATTGSY